MSEKKQKIKYFAYLRKSTEDDGRQVQSIADQENELNKIVERESLNVVRWFKEEKSARKPNNRPVFSDMIRRIKAGEANGILIYRNNRLSRNPLENGIVQQLLHDGLLVSIQTRDKEYTIKDNDILFAVEAGSSSQFSKDLSEDVKRGLEGKIRKGLRPGTATLGYINNKDKEKGEKDISPDPERFDLIRKMWDLMLSGHYLPSQIHRIANEELGIRSPKKKRTGGNKLSLSTIYKIFRRPFYAGLICWGSHKFEPGKHKQMVTLEEYDRVQELLGKRGNPRPRIYKFPFIGTIKCECGGMITAEIKRKINKKTGQIKKYTFYHCTGRKKGVKCSQRKYIRAEALNKLIEEKLSGITILPELIELIREILDRTNEKEIQDRTKIHEAVSRNLLDTQKELDTLLRMRLKDLITDEKYKEESVRLKAEIASLEIKRGQTEDRAKIWEEAARLTFNFAYYAKYWFLNGSIEDKKIIFVALGSNFLLKDRELTIEPSSWFIPIKNKYPQIEAKYIRFELHNTKELERTAKQKEIFEEIKNEISGRRESNPQQKLGRLWFYH